MNFKKVIAVMLCMVMSMSLPALADYIASEEQKTYVVLLDAPALLSPQRPSVYGDDTEKYKAAYREALIECQNEIKAQILSGRPALMSLDDEFVSYSYTDVLNGFTLRMSGEEAALMATLDGVEAVFENSMLTAVTPDEPHSEHFAEAASSSYSPLNSGNMINAPYVNNLGYNGSGRAVAVIDTRIEAHDYLALSDSAVPKYTKDDIEQIANQLALASTDGVYINEKIPFAYDYYYNKPGVPQSADAHGVHVSGIAAGNNHTCTSEGKEGKVSGIAPEAQIIFMGVFQAGGNASFDAVAKALDDAVKFDIDAVNLSISAKYLSENNQDDVIKALRAALANVHNEGISIVYAAGNDGHSGATDPKVADYSIGDNSSFPYALKVGSVGSVDGKAVAASTSSYCVSDTLDIAVDVSAPGVGIYSSVLNNRMGTMSGTSMAAPQVTGALCLIYDYIDKNFPSVTGKARAQLARQLICSTAENVYERGTDTLSSVRKVGAGVIKIDRAIGTKAVVVDSDGQNSRITLGDGIENSFELKFRVKNFGNEPLTFDKTTVELSTDGYSYDSLAGAYKYNGVKKVSANVSGDKALTVEAGGEAVSVLTIELDDSEMSQLASVMTNGFFIDGKVTLSSSSQDNCDIGIPFTGFRGNWNSQPIVTDIEIEANTYLQCERFTGHPLSICMTEKEEGEYVFYLSSKPGVEVRSGSMYFMITPERNAHITVSKGDNVLAESYIQKNYLNRVVLPSITHLIGDDDDVVVCLRLPGDIEEARNIKYVIKEDNVMPELQIVSMGENQIKITASDDRYVGTIWLISEKENGTAMISYKLFGEENAAHIFDISNFSDTDFYVYDMAFNCAKLLHGANFVFADGKVKIRNGSPTSVGGTLFVAAYNGNELIGIKQFENVTADAYADSKAAFDISAFEGLKFKLFYCTGNGDMIPLTKAYKNH